MFLSFGYVIFQILNTYNKIITLFLPFELHSTSLHSILPFLSFCFPEGVWPFPGKIHFVVDLPVFVFVKPEFASQCLDRLAQLLPSFLQLTKKKIVHFRNKEGQTIYNFGISTEKYPGQLLVNMGAYSITSGYLKQTDVQHPPQIN